MSKHSFTPGPWSCNAALSASENHKGYYIDARDEHGSVCVARVTPLDQDGVQGEANARLIAAAPDLLALVRRYASECGQCAGSGIENVKWFSTGIECDGERPCEECADIRAAIAKATGEA